MRKTSLVLLGAAVGAALTMVATQPALVGSDADAKTATKTDVYRLLNLFGDAFEQVRSHYVERPNDSMLVRTAVNGMLADLEDSYYIDPQALNRVEACTGPRCATAFGSVGVAYTMQDGLATVVTAIDDTPAAKAGIMTGDIIARVDDEQVQGLTYLQFGPKLVGEVGSTVKLTIVRPGGDKPIDIAIVRDNTTLRSVRARGEGGDIGYIRIIQFNEATADQLKKAIDDISAQIPPENLKGYVIDLRNNPGGTLDGAIAAADGFLDDGENRLDPPSHFRQGRAFSSAKAGDLAAGKPIVVLINWRLRGKSRNRCRRAQGPTSPRHRRRHTLVRRRLGFNDCSA